MIANLIDKQDNFEIVRDKLASILANEIANQRVLAVTAGKPNPDLWNFKTYTERSNPWELFLNTDQNTILADALPIVNVWFDNGNADPSKSNVIERQKVDGIFNVDVYAFGKAKDNPNGGHIAGDENAAKEVQRVYTLVRNILMAAEYTYLSDPVLNRFIWGRWLQSFTAFQPEQTNQSVQQVQAIRAVFQVTFNEFSPQVEGEPLELVTNTIKRELDGAIIAEANYDYTT